MKPIYALEKIGNPVLDGYSPSNPATTAKPYFYISQNEAMTDSGNAKRFVHHHADKVCFCTEEDKWYVWDGTVWKSDNHNQVRLLAQNTARSIFEEARHIQDANYKTALEKWGRESLNHGKLNSMLKEACIHLPVSLNQFDMDRWLLGVGNGVVDLRTGKLLPAAREMNITKRCGVSYDPEATCPRWLRFNEEVFAGKSELIRFVHKMVGYCLTGVVTEKCFFLLLGELGDNGKTVFINVLMELLGDYAVNMPIDSLLRRKPGAQSNDIVRLKGARFISCSEANRQYYFDEALVKRLTGNDPITARPLYKEHVTFRPEGKIVIGTNRVPRFDRNDTAFDNRVRKIPFNVTFKDDAKDEHLAETLRGEMVGILTWAVKGCLLWQREGLGSVPVNDEVNCEIRPDSSLEHFIETCCMVNNLVSCKTSSLYEAYLRYHLELGDEHEPINLAVFCMELSNMGFVTSHHRDGNYRVGILLRSTCVENQ